MLPYCHEHRYQVHEGVHGATIVSIRTNTGMRCKYLCAATTFRHGRLCVSDVWKNTVTAYVPLTVHVLCSADIVEKFMAEGVHVLGPSTPGARVTEST